VYVGVDEAGKGPVLGPMVAAAVRADPADLPDAVDDSKRLSADRRERLAAEIREAAAAVGVVRVGPDEIDDPATDMNGVTVRAHAAAVAAAAADGDRVLADAADVDPDRFARGLGEALADRESDAAVRARHGADAGDAVVGAASVIAKVDRDARIDRLRAAHGPVGSGYPGDPTTREFLREYVVEHGDVPPFARRSWATCADLLAAAEQSALDEF